MNIIQNNIRRMRDFFRYISRFRQRFEYAHILNHNVLLSEKEDEFYREMYEKYHMFIENYVVPSHSAEACNKIWICWLQGEKQAPPLVRCCIESVRRNMPDKEVVILSEETIHQYVHLPEHIWEKRRAGMISHAHFSDLLRITLLCEYGGIWCDATLLCTATPPKLMTDAPMFVFKSMDLQRADDNPILCSSWYISAWSNQPILCLTRDLLYEYWKDAECVGNYFGFHIFLAMAARRFPEDWAKIPFYNNHSPHTLQFELADAYTEERWDQILAMSPLHKLNHHNDYSGAGESMFRHILEEYIPRGQTDKRMEDLI